MGLLHVLQSGVSASRVTGFILIVQDVSAAVPNKPATYIAETGWPTASDTKAEENDGFAGADGDASVANLQSEPLRCISLHQLTL